MNVIDLRLLSIPLASVDIFASIYKLGKCWPTISLKKDAVNAALKNALILRASQYPEYVFFVNAFEDICEF